MRAPNILLITSDQHRGDCFGFAGRGVKTPHLDLMAAEGSRFATAITPNPVCQPALASSLTGKLPLTRFVRTPRQGPLANLNRAQPLRRLSNLRRHALQFAVEGRRYLLVDAGLSLDFL